MQTVAEGASLVTTVDLLGQLELFGRPSQKAGRSELLRRLRGGVVDLPDDSITVGMNVDAQFYELGFGSRFK